MASSNSDLPLTSRKFNVLIDVFVRHVYLWTLRNNERKPHASGTRRLAPQENALDPAENKFKVPQKIFVRPRADSAMNKKITIATTAAETGIAE